VLFDVCIVIAPCLFATAVVSASLPDLSCPLLLSIHCFCCIVPLTYKNYDDDDEDNDEMHFPTYIYSSSLK